MHIKKFKIFLEELQNQNTPQGYLDNVSKKKPTSPNQKEEEKPTDEVDDILRDTEQKKQDIIARKDAIEKGLLNNIRDMEPENQKDVQTQVKDYKTQVQEFDKTVQQIGKLNKTLQKSKPPIKQPKPYTQIARDKYKF